MKAIVEWPTPINVHDVRAFLGLCSYYQKFVPHFSEIATPLTRLTGKVKFEWTTDCQQAFDCLKEKLTSAPILALPRDDCKYVLDTDASKTAIGAVLSQIQDGEERVIAYAARTLNGPGMELLHYPF